MQQRMKTAEELRAENEELRARLDEAEETLRALRGGEVDALIVGDRLYRLEGVDTASNRFRGQILAQIYDAVIATDNDRRVTYLNAAAERLYGVTASEVLGRSIADVYRVRWPVAADEVAMNEAIRLSGHWRGENTHIRRTGEVLQVEATISHLADDEGMVVGTLAVVRDITSRKVLEKALADARQELERRAVDLEALVAQRTAKLNEMVQELEAFSYTIAHDMRAPLRAMQGFSNILIEEYGSTLDAAANDYLARIGNSASRLDALIQDVLQYSHIVRSDLELTVVDAGKLLADIVASYPNLRGDKVVIDVPAPLPILHANPAALTQVFSNLLGNAVKFVAPGVRPHIRISAEPSAGSDDFVRLWFEDNGIGIDAAAKARIFGMFQRLNRPGLYEGTGMGLAIVRKAAERMGGRVGVESEPGKGSRFWVELRKA